MNTDEVLEDEPIKDEDAPESADPTAEETTEEAPEDAATENAEPAPEPTPEEQVLIWKEAAMRSAAELENYRKRMAREKADSIRYANARLLEELLPVIDNFEMGMMAAEKEEGSMIHLGMQMVQKQLSDFLESQGVTIIKAEGAFDHTQHEAVSEEESTEVEPGHIVRVMRRGYVLNDRLLRAASVVVAKAPEAAETEPAE